MRNFLPKEFRFSHKFLFLLHDMLVSNITAGEKAKIFQTTIKFNSEKEANLFSKVPQEQMMEWLLNNRKLDCYEVSYKQIILATLADFTHFVYEALRCSQKGKLTVTYSLLRKPLKDNLLIFEWLLADPKDFLEKFHFGDIKDFDPSKVSKERKLEIIEKAVSSTQQKLFDAELIYQMRYDRSAAISFGNLGDKATHLITTFEKLKTEPQNLNFIFLSKGSQLSKWQHLYTWLPVLLYHTFEIVETLFETFTVKDQSIIDPRRDMCKIGFILWTENIGHSEKLKKPTVLAKCLACDGVTHRGKNGLWDIYRKGFISCFKCGANVYMNNILASPLYQKKLS